MNRVGGVCQPWPAGHIYNITFVNRVGFYGLSMYVEGVKVAELANQYTLGNNVVDINGGITRIKAQNGNNSRMVFSGLHNGVNKEVVITFQNSCGHYEGA